MGYSWVTHALSTKSMENRWTNHGQTMDKPWTNHGQTMDKPTVKPL
ncbi:hypothetical protein K4L44_08370 [Halosquirtibacter laminarini]|uniref:Uncharacterized protein n=1 Tax=Halosquirtibacter laminarini TaxID=3374600 RepID=A0AC61NJB2_9BACT|nr:hypothetical protein K4L44_08370 [Prolixibacteraceae bacterium]